MIFNDSMHQDHILNTISRLNNIISSFDLNKGTNHLRKAIFILIEAILTKIQSHSSKKLFDIYILREIANRLLKYLGRFNDKPYLMIIAQIMVLECGLNNENSDEIHSNNVQTDTFKQLVNSAKSFIVNIKQDTSDYENFSLNSNGFNSVLEIFCNANYLCRADGFLMEEAINYFSEYSRNQLFPQSLNAINEQDTINMQITLFWISLMNDTRNLSSIPSIYSQTLKSINNMILSSFECKKIITQNVLALISLPWIAQESNAHDLDLFKDKNFKLLSQYLIQNSSEELLIELKCECIKLLCLFPRNFSSSWRIYLITKCLKDHKNDTIRKITLKFIPYLLYNLGVSSNSLVFQVLCPQLENETSDLVFKEYSNLFGQVCCILSRKCFLYCDFKKRQAVNFLEELENEPSSNDGEDLTKNLRILCTCCDNCEIESLIKLKLRKPKNIELMDTLKNRPKLVDSTIVVKFLTSLVKCDDIKIKNEILTNLDRVFNHIEFPRVLEQVEDNPYTFIFKESMSLLSNESIDSLIRANFGRFTIRKMVFSQNDTQNSQNSLSEINDHRSEFNYLLESQLCNGLLKSKLSKNTLNEYIYIISLGRFALSIQCNEYLFITVKHLLEVFDSNDPVASSLAERQLSNLSKNLNMQELLHEFTEKVCELIADFIFNSIARKINHNYDDNELLNLANYSLKDLLRIFNVNDSFAFIRNYQKYLIPHIILKACISSSNYKAISKSIEFLAKKICVDCGKLIQDNFPFIFTFTSLYSKEFKSVFQYISCEACLDVNKLILSNTQRLFNELLSHCGNPKYKSIVWHSIKIIQENDHNDAQFDERQVVKYIEPNLLASLIHFDMCLMRSSVNIKEKCQVLESLNVLIGMLGVDIITKVRYKIMTTLKLAMQQCSKYSELNCKLWDTFVRNVDKQALGPILNQIAVSLLQLLEQQPFKVSKIFEYLILQNSQHLQEHFDELYFIPEHNSLQKINQTLLKYTDLNYLLEKKIDKSSLLALSNVNSINDEQLKALVSIIKHYLKGATHENADLRIKALEKLYFLLKDKSSQIIHLIQRQNNSDILSEIVLSLLNGCRDTNIKAKLLFACCLGEIGAIDPANIITSDSSLIVGVTDATTETISNKRGNVTSSNGSSTSSVNSSSSSILSSTSTSSEFMNPSLASEESNEFSDYFSKTLIMELSKAYLAARNTHEQDSASYAIQECLKIYGCSATDPSTINRIENKKLWNSFPDYVKEILTPLRTSKYEIQAFGNFCSLKTPIILSENECKTYEEWVYKWCAYLISKLSQACTKNTEGCDKEIQIFPKLLFIIRFNVNVALFILPYIIIKIIILNYSDTINQIYEEMMSVVQLSELNEVSNKKIIAYKHICCQTVFNIHDHLVRQLNHYRAKVYELQQALKQKASSKTAILTKRLPPNVNESLLIKFREAFDSFDSFLKRLPQQIFSKASLECKAYCRALMYYEIYMKSINSYGLQGSTIVISQNHLNELQNIYSNMDHESGIDAAGGILLLRKGTEESLADAAFRHKINGRLNESIACLEQMLESSQSAKQDLKQHEAYLCTFISIGRQRNALNYIEGLMNDKQEWKDQLNSYRIECCWKLSSWDKLKSVSTSNTIAKDELNSFNAGIGKLFCSVDGQKEEQFYETLKILREQQIAPLSAVSMESGGGSYQRGYEYIVNLQILQEIESSLCELIKCKSENDRNQYKNLLNKNLETFLIEPWERRVETMQPSYKRLEPIYNVRIALLNFISDKLGLNLNSQIAKLWLRLAKIARKASMFENSYQYMLNAQGKINKNDTNNLEELLIEKSKWYWQREDRDSAIFYLNKGLNELFAQNVDGESNELYSKVLLMYTKFSEENGSLDTDSIRKNYLSVQKMCSKMEQSHFQLAQFTDRLGMSVSENTGKKEKFWEYITEIIGYYASSLEYGCEFIYQSLPRMMSLWLDFGADYFDHSREALNTSSKSQNANRNLSQLNVILTKLNQTISNALQRLPTYTFLTVYSQLVSRICHPEDRVFETLSNIIMKVLLAYRHQAMWMLIAVKNSSVELRRNRCKIIVDKAIKQQSSDFRKFINDSSELAEKLVQLGNLNTDPGVSQLSLAQCFKPLKRLVESKDFSPLLIPSQFQITLQLPTSGNSSSTSQSSSLPSSNNSQLTTYRTHNPYPLDLVYIYCFEDTVSVMNSLQKPKKVTIRGTDGKMYSFLCKSKDDLRIDFRIMEFFSVVNKCLKQEPESRRRNLHIRTYAVTPLNEFCGIIEWIENLATLRSILLKLYSEKGIGPITSSEWRQHEERVSRDKEYALKVYRLFLDRYRPSVLNEWFIRTFPEPNSWYNARLNYVRTAAVMSVCGYILGLGDRHCENITIASSNGDCIHVDFNCLFNKGEALGVPEIVPFRLTHNMIDAMGPLGYEGVFRKICEVSLKVLRDNREPLLTILKTFIYDPLVEWKTSSSKSNEIGETVSAKGQVHLQNITSRLKGMHAKQWLIASQKIKALPLSVEGHVNSLIKESSDEKNLSLMYIGWAPFF